MGSGSPGGPGPCPFPRPRGDSVPYTREPFPDALGLPRSPVPQRFLAPGLDPSVRALQRFPEPWRLPSPYGSPLGGYLVWIRNGAAGRKASLGGGPSTCVVSVRRRRFRQASRGRGLGPRTGPGSPAALPEGGGTSGRPLPLCRRTGSPPAKHSPRRLFSTGPRVLGGDAFSGTAG